MADTNQILRLAAIIREVDGTHSKGAAALAESILDHPRFRAVLAGEPAVPEGREPAAVTGQPSDETCWQWYTYCPEEGLEMYSDRKQAQSAAQSIMGSYEVAAYSDGWHEDMKSVSWGMLVPVEQAQVVARKTAEPDSGFDEWVKYELRAVLWGNHFPDARKMVGQPALPAEGEVGDEARYLAKELRDHADDLSPSLELFDLVHRAAELLQRQVLPEVGE